MFSVARCIQSRLVPTKKKAKKDVRKDKMAKLQKKKNIPKQKRFADELKHNVSYTLPHIIEHRQTDTIYTCLKKLYHSFSLC